MIDTRINLARRWRSKNFDQIVGQNLSVRMLKNSLYLGHYFPVYLFSGQRGCGKTTTARVFSSAINCKLFSQFQKDPKNYSIPCLVCDSCVAMSSGIHPDFIEIDAASHTGVDHVRQIIDAASLLPVMGIKKIYLIDEAHMLSKAAFNAFLKILEEPPLNVVFILATTDAQKIIETVKSRCFQLLFKAIEKPLLLEHLQQVCRAENITYDAEGLSLIINETDGSARDALNIVEQIRFAYGSITKQAVLSVLDHLDTESFIRIIELIVAHDTHGMLVFLKSISLERFSAEYIWRRFIELIRALLWFKHGVSPDKQQDFQVLKHLVATSDLVCLNTILKLIYVNEEIFLKTTAQHLFLELFFIQLCQQGRSDDNGSVPALSSSTVVPVIDDIIQEEVVNQDQDANLEYGQHELRKKWQQFIEVASIKNEPLLYSVLSQGICSEVKRGGVNNEMLEIIVQFPKELSFFESVIHDNRTLWYSHFQVIFSLDAQLVMSFISKSVPDSKIDNNKVDKKVDNAHEYLINNKESLTKPVFKQKIEQKQREYKSERSVIYKDEQGNAIDISDPVLWKKTHMILHYFHGVVREVR